MQQILHIDFLYQKSSVTKHMLENKHCFDLSGLKLVKRVDEFYKLNAFDKLMNENFGPISNSISTKYYN